ncbi:MAG: hypothetical protein HKN80_13370 [Acidimicrobiia bacterium]|nr:hypothetical protein [Acidimicrobiia bacterium]
MSELILQGPFLTRSQAARRARVPVQVLVHRPDLLRVGGGWLQEVYFGFQFDDDGVRPEIGRTVQSLKPKRSDPVIGDWLVRPNRSLGHTSPLRYLNSGGSVERVVELGEREVPTLAPPSITDQLESDAPAAAPVAAPTRKGRRRAVSRRPAMGAR